jgi:hypothetical protein
MATYFKYAEREADSQINWAEIGKNMSDMLKEQNRIREEKKAEIDKASQEYGELLSNPPQGEFKAMNQWTIEYANDYQQNRLMQDKLLKSGQLKVRDYMIMRQNSTDGTNQLFDLSKQYQEVYKTKMDRRGAGDNQLLEMKLMADAEGLANFMNTKAYINPTDGTVSIGKMVTGPDGVKKMSDNPNDFMTVVALGNSIKDNYDRFKSTEAVAGYVEGLGQQIDVITSIKNKYQRGTITEILDITQRENLPADAKGVVMKFEEAETKWLSGFLSDELHVTSILTEDIKMAPNGKPYDYTWSEEEAKANPEMILLKNNSAGRPVPFPSPEQEKAALESLRVKARLMYDKKESVSVVAANEVPQKTEATLNAEALKREKEKLFDVWQQLRNGDDAQKDAALQSIKGSPLARQKGLVYIGFDSTGENVIIKYKNAQGQTISPSPIPMRDNPVDWFEQGTEIFGDFTQEDVNRWAKGNRQLGGGGLSATVDVQDPTTDKKIDMESIIRNDLQSTLYIHGNSDEKTAEHLNNLYSKKYGVSVYPLGSDKIEMVGYDAEGKVVKETYDVDDDTNLQRIKDFYYKYYDRNIAKKGVGSKWG